MSVDRLSVRLRFASDLDLPVGTLAQAGREVVFQYHADSQTTASSVQGSGFINGTDSWREARAELNELPLVAEEWSH